VVNADGDGGGWVRVGRHRFRARAKAREEGSVKIGAGTDWSLDVEEL
jgi:hypothetical protein